LRHRPTPRTACRPRPVPRRTATLAGVRVEYRTRLGQVRDRNPSVQVPDAVADALNLSVR
ncbi:transcriptional regulator, partial [Streptomyces sp. NPDC058830]